MLPNNMLERQQVSAGRTVLAMDCALAEMQWASCPSAELYR